MHSLHSRVTNDRAARKSEDALTASTAADVVDDRIPIKEIARAYRTSTKTMRSLLNLPGAPKPIKMGPRMTRYRRREVFRFLDEQLNQSTTV